MNPTLILIPGLVCDAAAWHAQTTEFGDLFDILIPNLNSPDTPEAMVNAVLDGAPDQFYLAGHSMGGWVALELMRHHSHRVQALCLANTSARLDSKDKAATRHKLIDMYKSQQHEALSEILLNAFVYQHHVNDLVSNMIRRNLDALVSQEHAMLTRKDCVPLLNSITCPTQVIYSDHDNVFDESHSQEIVSHINQAETVRITDAGHMSLMEKPEQFNQAIKKWLEL